MVYSTESMEKVDTAIRNLFGEIPLRHSDRGSVEVIEGELETIEGLSTLRDVLRRMRIRDAAFHLLTHAASGKRLSFGLNKQAAYVGKASFHRSGESPLGPIQVVIEGDVESAIKYLCK